MLALIPFVSDSDANKNYLTADGGKVYDLGKKVLVGNVGGQRRAIIFRSAQVSNPLLSVSNMVDQGCTVIFSPDGLC